MPRDSNSPKNMSRKRPLPDRHAFRSDQDKDYGLLKVTSNLKKLEEFEKAVNKYMLAQGVRPCILNLLNHKGPFQKGTKFPPWRKVENQNSSQRELQETVF